MTSAVTSGDLIVVAVASWNGNGNATVSAVTDNAGNIYTKAVEDPSPATGSTQPVSVWYAANVVGRSSLTVTVSLANPGGVSVAVHEYRGVPASNVVDGTAHASTTGTTASSGSTTATTSAPELLFGASTYVDPIVAGATPGTGYTLRQSETDNSCCSALYTEDRVVQTTGSYTATFTYPQSVSAHTVVVAFR